MNTINIIRSGSTLATVNIDEKTVLSKKLMGEHKIKAEFYTESSLGLQVGDYITYNSENYYLNRLPEVKKINNKTYKYACEFEADIYTLYNKIFMWSDQADFSYTGAPTDFITLIVGQVNQIDANWTVGDVDTADEQTLTFSNISCRQALTQVAEAFGFEFQITGKAINLKASVGNATTHRFEYGRNRGLYALTREQISDQNIVTRVYGFGGSTNIDSTYRDRVGKTIFASKYLEANTGLYGVIEGVFNDEKIYPRRTGTITAVNNALDSENNWNAGSAYVEDSSLDFDINDYLVSGETAKIVFKSGDLSGFEFEIWKYDVANKRIYFNYFTESDSYIVPNSLNLPAIDDQYTLIGITMPQSYIDAAEAELQATTQTYLDQNSVPQVTYSLDIDPRYVKVNSISLDTGDLVTIFDSALGIDSLIRVSELQLPLVDPNKVKATISDQIVYTTTERIIRATVQAKQEITNTQKNLSEAIRVSNINKKYGPSATFQGDYDVANTYYGNSTRVDVVKYNGAYYIARIDAGEFYGILPTDGSKWQGFGSNFESIATGLLFAELAYIQNLGVSYLRTATTGQRVEIDGATGTLAFYDSSDDLIASLANGKLVVQQALIGSGDSSAGLAIEDNNIAAKGDYLNINQGSLFSGSLEGMVSSMKTLRIFGGGGIYAGLLAEIYPKSANVITPNAYMNFKGAISAGFPIERTASTSKTLTNEDQYVIYTGASTATWYLPATPYDGKYFLISREENITFTINGNGNDIISGEATVSTTLTLNDRRMLYIFTWDGTYWQYHRIDRS